MRATSDLRWLILALLCACGRARHNHHHGDDPPNAPEPESTVLTAIETPPEVRVRILSLDGASGADGSFQVGDRLRVNFSAKKRDGSRWGLDEFPFARILVSGPTSRYQRVIAEQDDLLQRSQVESNGSITYHFAKPLPEEYLAPLNDTPHFDANDGERAGQPLGAGTYTVGLTLSWDYTIFGEPGTHVRTGEDVAHFRFGGANAIVPRAVTSVQNCNRCHVDLQAHEGRHRELALCLLCHTVGAEDLNDPNLGGGTDGVTIDSRVLFHRIHNARHLPSVQGFYVDATGLRQYDGTPKPYRVASSARGLVDFSHIGLPVWPNKTEPMPANEGWSGLDATARERDLAVRTGIGQCYVCHGDPDGAGPVEAPAQGGLIEVQPSRLACGACHDDHDFTKEWLLNQHYYGPMPPQPDDQNCTTCHDPDFPTFPPAVRASHAHPLRDPEDVHFLGEQGLELSIDSVGEGSTSDSDGVIEVGESIQVDLSLVDGDGAAVDPSSLGGLEAALSGPTQNPQLLLSNGIPLQLLSGSSPWSIDLSERLELEFAGDSSAGLESFSTSRAPHFHSSGAPTVVRVRTSTGGGASSLTDAASAPANFVVVVDPSGFARDDWLVLDDGAAGLEEYLRIQHVDGARLWFSSPATPAYAAGLRHAHAAGASVSEVGLTQKTLGVDWSLDAAAGQVTELVDFGAGAAVLVSYTARFLVPPRYGAPLHDSPDLGEDSGEWSGKSLVDGDYRLALSAWRDVTLNSVGEDNAYRFSSRGASITFPIGVAGPAVDAIISSPQNCQACHQDLRFHGSTWRGFESCIVCHGTSGAEDLPSYVAANAPSTSSVSVGFRELLHAVHRGHTLDHADTFQVITAGASPWPDNWSAKTYDHVAFPVQPGATQNCQKCHGAGSSSWREPAARDHPTEPQTDARVWRAACAGCHAADAARAHIDAQTAGGVESCAVCHGPGEPFSVELAHEPRSP